MTCDRQRRLALQKQAWRKHPDKAWLARGMRLTDSMLVSLRQAGLYEKAKELEDLVAFDRARLRMMKGEITSEEALTLSPRGRELLAEIEEITGFV